MLSVSPLPTSPLSPDMAPPDAILVRELDVLLTALGLHPMNSRQSFKILRLNLRDMNTHGLPAEIVQLKEKFAALGDEALRTAWHELHNPFRDLDRGAALSTERRLPPYQKVQILMLYAAARRIYPRYIDDPKAAETIAVYWTCWRIHNLLHLSAPMVRLALALDLSREAVMNHFKGYHRAVRWIEGEIMGEAHREFFAYYAQMADRVDNPRQAG